MKFLLASLKTLSNSKNCSESRIKYLFRLSFAFPVYIHSRLLEQKIFQDHRRASEQLLETQAAIRKPRNMLYEDGYWKEFHN
jgi:hypothetical protein